MRKCCLLLALCPCFAIFTTGDFPAYAEVISQWNFNSVPPDGSTSTGTNVPSVGYGTAALIGGTTAGYATGSTNDPATSSDDSGWNTAHYPGQSTGNKSAGVQFNISTLGYSNIEVRWDQRVSGSASRYYRFQWSADGNTFNDASSAIVMNASPSTASYYEAQANNLSGNASVENNAQFAFRIVSEFQSTATGAGADSYVTVSNGTYSTSGTVRFDFVTVTGTAIPGANTPPTISTVSNQTLRVNQATAALPLLVNDAEDPAGSLTLNARSSDPAVIPESNVVFGGSGGNRTVTVSAGNQTGASVVTLDVIDTGGRSNSTSFTVTVLPLNTAPTISVIPPTNTTMNVPTPAIDFTVNDLETAAGNLALSASSSNPSLVPAGNLVFGGSGSNRTVTVIPAPGQTGVAPLIVTVSDGVNASSTDFAVMVTPSSDVIFYDPFAYADGSLLTNSAFLWGNRSGTVGQCQVTNGQLLVIGATGEDVSGELAGGPYVKTNGFVLYAGFKMTFLDLPKPVPGYFAHFVGGSSLRGRVYAGTTNAGSGSFRLFVANGSDAVTMVPQDLSVNTAYDIVTRYDVDNASTTLWIQPGTESDSGTTATDTQTAVTISSYGFRQDSSLGATVLVDDVRVGRSFASVVSGGASVAPIPLVATRWGNQIVLNWNDPGFGLQSGPNATGTFTNIPGASSPYTNALSGRARFFRLKEN